MVSSGYPVAPLTQTLSPSQASANPAISRAPTVLGFGAPLLPLIAFPEGQGRDASHPAGPVIRRRLPFIHSPPPPAPRIPLVLPQAPR